MCGIAGFSGNFSAPLLAQMAERISHRGPDASGTCTPHPMIGLAHQRLSIIDLSKEAEQPMATRCSHCPKHLWLIYNGELYNYKELKAELIQKGHQFYTQGDSEILLHLYAEEGSSMLNRLNGIFAFAIYDDRDQSLFLARDHLGVKPLYYSQLSQGFLFASEIKSLLACDELSNKIDLQAIHYYLAYLWCPGKQTALEQIKKVEAGEALIIKNGKITKQWFYYDIPYTGQYASETEAQLCEQLTSTIQQAIKKQLIADVPIGAFLSGGLDSSAIVAMMKQLYPDTFMSYCIGFKEGMASEGNPNDIPYAQKVAAHLNTPLEIIEVNANLINNLPYMLYHLDEPQADPAPLHVALIAQLAQQQNIKVLLSGAGGDDIFSGYRRHTSIHLDKLLNWLPLVLRSKMSQVANHFLNGHYASNWMQSTSFRRIAKWISAAHLSSDERMVNHFLWSSEQLRRTLYTEDMASHLNDTLTAEPLLHSLNRIPHEKNPLNRLLYLESKHFLPCHNLNYTDKMAMAFGVEVRVPYLDKELVEFATRIPPQFKQKKGINKALFKKAMEPYLPKSVIYRPKAGFGAPVRQWLHHELRPFVYDMLSEERIKKRNIFNPKMVQQLLKWDETGRVDAAYTIFSLLCIEIWSTLFVDQRASIKPTWNKI